MRSQEAKKGNFEKKLEYIGQRLDVEFGTFTLTDAYVEAIRYPFRPSAAKAVVGIISTPCEKSPFPLSVSSPDCILIQTFNQIDSLPIKVSIVEQMKVIDFIVKIN